MGGSFCALLFVVVIRVSLISCRRDGEGGGGFQFALFLVVVIWVSLISIYGWLDGEIWLHICVIDMSPCIPLVYLCCSSSPMSQIDSEEALSRRIIEVSMLVALPLFSRVLLFLSISCKRMYKKRGGGYKIVYPYDRRPQVVFGFSSYFY